MPVIALRMVDSGDYPFLYKMLGERSLIDSISHRKMPTYEEHVAFCDAGPYKGWYIIILDEGGNGKHIGNCYISKQNELGIFLKKEYQRKGISQPALQLLMSMYPGVEFLANIAPGNARSITLFEQRLGFQHVQNTYRR